MDDDAKGFLKGTIEGDADSISDADKAKLVSKIKEYIKDKEMKFEYKKSEKLTAGYKLTINDMQVDASIDKQFDILKDTILSE